MIDYKNRNKLISRSCKDSIKGADGVCVFYVLIDTGAAPVGNHEAKSDTE